MRALAFAVFLALAAVAHGLWPFSSADAPAGIAGEGAKVGSYAEQHPRYRGVAELWPRQRAVPPGPDPKPMLPTYHFPVGKWLSIRHDLSVVDMLHASKLAKHGFCKFFDLELKEDQVHLETCVKYFSNLGNVYDHYHKVKTELVAWEERNAHAQEKVQDPG
jgi:hypothetical protein